MALKSLIQGLFKTAWQRTELVNWVNWLLCIL